LRIKSIVLHGFKSFADKEVLHFNEGISCIVGPNGSGKSNLLDAIKWIMGEQNIKELRGRDLEDIIFNGSKNREASNIAMVTLTLTDIDETISEKWGVFSEVSITRKYYRTGEREYYLNNKSCRLKDIKEFFYDIGISHKSIILIEQGKVDKIIQANPEELREIFEEFAGIVNYKDKKKEAQKKLEQTTFNLERIKDIYKEVEENKKLFSKQVDELEKYKKLMSLKKNTQKTVFSINYKYIIDSISKINFEKTKLEKRKTSVETEYNNLIKINNERKDKLNSLKKEYEAIRERSYLIKNEIEKNRTLKNATQEKLELYKEEISKIEGRINVLVKTINEKKEKQKLLEEKIASLRKEFFNIKNNKENLDINQKELNKKIRLYKEKQKDIDKNIFSLMDYMKRLDQDIYEKNLNIKNIKKEQERLIIEKKQIEAEIDGYTQKINNITLQEKETNEKLIILNEEFEKKQASIDILRKMLDTEHIKLNKLNNDRREIENKIVLLKNLIEQIIVGDSKEYKKFIDKYPHTNLIDEVELKNTAELISYGSIIIFKDEVKNELLNLFDSNYWPINFIFAEELETFLNKIKTIPVGIIRNNLIHNGLYYMGKRPNDNRENLLIYKSDLKNLEIKKINIDEEINKIKTGIDKIYSELNSSEISLNKDLEQINQLTILLEKIRREREYSEKEINKLLMRSTTITKEEKRLQDELKKYESSLEKNKNEKENIANKLLNLENESKVVKSNINEINKEFNNNSKELTALTIKYSEINKELEVLEKTYKEDKINLSNLESEQIELESKLIKYKEIIITSEETLRDLDEKIIELKSNDESIKEHNNMLMLEIEEYNKNVNELSIKIDKLANDIKEIETKYNKHLVNEAKIISNKNNLLSQYMQQYNANLEEEFSYCYREINVNELEKELLKIEEEISRLGPINMGAADEYKKLDERSIFLNNQLKDLEGAIEKISEMIYNFDKESISRFNETFYQVKENFKKVVKILFNGGSSDIKIINDNDLLDSGIEIYIQPPGKKLQNLNLLSGGEKALMSCALLFAFFLYRKAPFCFLDEIDAPLDNANIGRFLDIVKTLSVDTQFFIISHNYNTLLESDNIYGVTMKEPGVSEIYSLKKEDLVALNR
jgi:chromosome segregation protein